MTSLPSDRQLPTDILEAVQEKTFEGQQRLVTWLFLHFSRKTNPDTLAGCLLEFTARLRGGFVPEHPVGLFRTMLFARRCDLLRREKRASQHVERLRSERSAARAADPGAAFEMRDLWSAVYRAALFDFPPEMTTLILARAFGWDPKVVRRSLEEHFHGAWSKARAHRVWARAKRQLQARFKDR
jgi:hypothetical protein